jgi:hypothetical protein
MDLFHQTKEGTKTRLKHECNEELFRLHDATLLPNFYHSKSSKPDDIHRFTPKQEERCRKNLFLAFDILSV